jgi:hypothetical protein
VFRFLGFAIKTLAVIGLALMCSLVAVMLAEPAAVPAFAVCFPVSVILSWIALSKLQRCFNSLEDHPDVDSA